MPLAAAVIVEIDVAVIRPGFFQETMNTVNPCFRLQVRGVAMKTFILKLPAAEVVHLLRAETTSAYGAPELHTAAEKEYIIEEDFDRSAYCIHDGEEFDLVTSIATLTIEPRVDSGYWILERFVERALGLIRTSQGR